MLIICKSKNDKTSLICTFCFLKRIVVLDKNKTLQESVAELEFFLGGTLKNYNI
jgi:hypothetical protein